MLTSFTRLKHNQVLLAEYEAKINKKTVLANQYAFFFSKEPTAVI